MNIAYAWNTRHHEATRWLKAFHIYITEECSGKEIGMNRGKEKERKMKKLRLRKGKKQKHDEK
jgi:hypothetical protein